MTVRIDEHGAFDRARVKAEIDRLERLARDLCRMLAEGPPRLGEHEDAPIMLDTRLDTPPFSNRRHPLSAIAPTPGTTA
jgi:hypothetical protein